MSQIILLYVKTMSNRNFGTERFVKSFNKHMFFTKFIMKNFVLESKPKTITVNHGHTDGPTDGHNEL